MARSGNDTHGAKDSSDDGDDHAFGKCLANQSPRAGSEGAADRDLLAALSEANEEEMCEIRAGHEKYEGRCRPSEEQRWAHRARGFFGQRCDERADRCISIGVRRRGAAGEGLNLGLSLGNRNAALEPRDQFERMVFAACGELGFDQRERDPYVGPGGNACR